MKWLNKLLGKSDPSPESLVEPDDDDDGDGAFDTAWYEHKTALFESRMGTEYDRVMHAVFPYFLGGGLDLYYYPNDIPGTGIATKELATSPTEGSTNRDFTTYELVMFTRHPVDLDAAKDDSSEFGQVHSSINAILNLIARYSADAVLNPNETCEFPADMENVGGKCLVFDSYAVFDDDVVDRFGLLLIMEIFRSEMDFAREHGSSELFAKLKAAGHYPYSDLDRDAVV